MGLDLAQSWRNPGTANVAPSAGPAFTGPLALPPPRHPNHRAAEVQLDDLLHAARHSGGRLVAGLSDQEIIQIMKLADKIGDPERLKTLRLLLRPRLATLRPPRPLLFERLLFLPLDPVIVERKKWSPGAPFRIPRSAMRPISRAVRRNLPTTVLLDMDEALAGRTTADHAAIEELGPPLWKHAAKALGQQNGSLPGWHLSGHSLAEGGFICHGCARLWQYVATAVPEAMA
ncbi:hypothetical protein [Rhodovastum atsumiense]|uniref:Uncharacterized protein n=1 Tax=Rhodovastum atsumiense TaxID=504468 RepID=A0A5M6IZH9_9PROT|nr:hypothetical protein [Rhodovastum atsumiense]KAA5612785.1 hypothetical protein F1189_08600 [Rhodovastum atsumiense]